MLNPLNPRMSNRYMEGCKALLEHSTLQSGLKLRGLRSISRLDIYSMSQRHRGRGALPCILECPHLQGLNGRRCRPESILILETLCLRYEWLRKSLITPLELLFWIMRQYAAVEHFWRLGSLTLTCFPEDKCGRAQE